MPNTDLLNRTLNYIEAHPGEWDQNQWAARNSCGTVYCFAGTAVMLSELPIEWRDSYQDHDYYGEIASYIASDAPAPYADRFISTAARELLELSEAQSDRLFDPVNKLADLRRLVAELTAAEPALDAVAGV